MKRKLNKKKVIICIILLITFVTMPAFGRYIYNSARDLYLKSQNFSFSSNLLTNSGKTYRYSNWSGVDNYELDLQLYSYENELSLFTYEDDGLEYELTCSVATIDDKVVATAHIGTIAGTNTSESYIPNLTNVKDVKIYLKPTENLKEGDTVKVTVTAKTESPYKKEISATFNIRVKGQNVSYSIEDSATSIYATLKLINTKSTQNEITLTFDPSLVLIDTTDDCYVNRISQTSRTISGVKYVNSVTFNMEAEDVKYIKFYKKNINANYTYPGGTYGSMVVGITETN